MQICNRLSFSIQYNHTNDLSQNAVSIFPRPVRPPAINRRPKTKIYFMANFRKRIIFCQDDSTRRKVENHAFSSSAIILRKKIEFFHLQKCYDYLLSKPCSTDYLLSRTAYIINTIYVDHSSRLMQQMITNYIVAKISHLIN